MDERRSVETGAKRPHFSELARRALEKNVPATHQTGTEWGGKANLGWARLRQRDGSSVYLALRRHLDWVTGEIGVSPQPLELEALELRAVPDPSPAAGYRVRLGHLLHDEDRWWRAGGTMDSLEERLEWLALQMGVKLPGFLREASHT